MTIGKMNSHSVANTETEVQEVGTVQCDISAVPSGSLQSRKNYSTGESYDFAYLTCKMRTSFSAMDARAFFTTLDVEVLINQTSVGRAKISISNGRLQDPRNPYYGSRGSTSSTGSGSLHCYE